jgi:cell wall-associated NlpC family hydrolase
VSVIAGQKHGRHLAPRKVTAPLTEIAQVVVSESMQRRTAVLATTGGILISAFGPATATLNPDALNSDANTGTFDLSALRTRVDAFTAAVDPALIAPVVTVAADSDVEVEALLSTGVAAVAATPAPGVGGVGGIEAEGAIGIAPMTLALDRSDRASRTGARTELAAFDLDLDGGWEGGADLGFDAPVPLPGLTGADEDGFGAPTDEFFPEFPDLTLPVITPPVIAIPAPEPEVVPEPVAPVTPVAPIAPVAPVAPVTPVTPIAPPVETTPPAAITPPPAQNTAPPATVAGNEVLEKAATLVGIPYRAGGSSQAGFDCSGFTQYVFGALGVDLPRTSRAQKNAGTIVSASEARPGDLIWSPGHVAIYAGNGTQIDAPRPGRSVQFRNIWQRNPVFVRVG